MKKKTDETIKAKIPIVFIHSSRYQLTIEINKKLQMKWRKTHKKYSKKKQNVLLRISGRK